MTVAPFMLRHGGHVGQSAPRDDGREKLRGEALYAAEHRFEGLLHGFPVSSDRAAGRIVAIDTAKAERVPGVVAVITRKTVPRQGPLPPARANFLIKLLGPKPVFREKDVAFHGQYIALVVAESYEAARDAAALVEVTLEHGTPLLDFDQAMAAMYRPKTVNGGAKADTSEGDVEAALASAAFSVDETYETPYEHANPMEPHAAVAAWRDGRLLLHDSSQSVSVSSLSLAATLLTLPRNIELESRYVGGGFGSKFGLRPHAVMAALAAKVVGRPVKVALTRQQSFTGYGHRTRTRQRMRLGADEHGRLAAFSQDCWSQTSMDDEFVEQSGGMGRLMYAAPNRSSTHRVARMNLPTPSYMRAPGEAPGSFAVESAMDELAHRIGMDPIALRLANEPATDPDTGLPWSSRSLRQCLEQGAARFNWQRRVAAPGAVRDGRWLVGMGVAAASYPARNLPAAASLSLSAEGVARLEIGASDIGTGACTALRQLTADAVGLPMAKVEVVIGHSKLPKTFGAAGSSGTASWGSAVAGAAAKLQAELAKLARGDRASPLHGINSDDLVLENGRLALRDDPRRGESIAALIARAAPEGVRAHHNSLPPMKATHAAHAFGAQFAELGVDMDTGEIRLRRLLGCFGVGRVVNPRATESQLIGGITMGVGMALMEQTLLDTRWGQWLNRDLAEYHIPVNADMPPVEAMWVVEEDAHVNALGVKGVGEIGIVGVAAAVANAVFNAAGVRVRDLPVTLDKVLAGLPDFG